MRVLQHLTNEGANKTCHGLAGVVSSQDGHLQVPGRPNIEVGAKRQKTTGADQGADQGADLEADVTCQVEWQERHEASRGEGTNSLGRVGWGARGRTDVEAVCIDQT